MSSPTVTSLAEFFARAALFIDAMPSDAAIGQASTAELVERMQEADALRRDARYFEAALALELVLRRFRRPPVKAEGCTLIARPD
jgi:hypothetical protein